MKRLLGEVLVALRDQPSSEVTRTLPPNWPAAVTPAGLWSPLIAGRSERAARWLLDVRYAMPKVVRIPAGCLCALEHIHA